MLLKIQQRPENRLVFLPWIVVIPHRQETKSKGKILIVEFGTCEAESHGELA